MVMTTDERRRELERVEGEIAALIAKMVTGVARAILEAGCEQQRLLDPHSNALLHAKRIASMLGKPIGVDLVLRLEKLGSDLAELRRAPTKD